MGCRWTPTGVEVIVCSAIAASRNKFQGVSTPVLCKTARCI